MLAKFIRLFGLFLIVGFSAVSIFFSLVHRDMEEGPSKEMMSYPSYFEGRFYDYRASLTRKKDNFDKRIVLAQIDDPSLQEIGSFPWARTIYADLLHKLNTFGAKVVSFDVFFPEKQRACPGENPDGIFAQAIKDFEAKPGNKVILGYTMDAYGAEYFKEPPEHLLNFMIDTKQTGDATLVDRVVSKAAYPIPTIANTEAGLGHVQTKQDTDGIYRQYELLSNVDGLTFPSFSLLTYEKYADDRASLEVTGLGDGVLTLKNGKVGLNHQGETKVNWLGNEKSFPAVSIIDILKAKDDDQKMKEIFDSNIVFIGSIAFGAHDLDILLLIP